MHIASSQDILGQYLEHGNASQRRIASRKSDRISAACSPQYAIVILLRLELGCMHWNTKKNDIIYKCRRVDKLSYKEKGKYFRGKGERRDMDVQSRT